MGGMLAVCLVLAGFEAAFIAAEFSSSPCSVVFSLSFSVILASFLQLLSFLSGPCLIRMIFQGSNKGPVHYLTYFSIR